MVIGDLVQQEQEYTAKLLPTRYDWIRSGKIALLLLLGTLQTAWRVLKH